MADTRKVIRIAKKDLNSDLTVERSLWAIKGIGKNYAHAIRMVLGVDNKKKLGELSDEELAKLEDIVQNPSKYNIPRWMYNHRFERETGEDKHYVEASLDFKKKMDIDFMKKIRCWKGFRHQLGQPVRGQRTKAHFRTGPAVGVMKKKEMPGKSGSGSQSSGGK